MSETLLALVAFSSIVVAAILLVGLNWPAKIAMRVAFGLTVASALMFWDMAATGVLALVLQGLGVTVSFLCIGFVALFLLNAFNHTA
ncbi:hypothetical protein SZ06_19635, partial [Vibrio parahaemolyticus]